MASTSSPEYTETDADEYLLLDHESCRMSDGDCWIQEVYALAADMGSMATSQHTTRGS